MKYLLHSHVVVWAIYEPQKLSSLVFTLLADQANELILSHVTLQELLNKVGRGKLPIAGMSVSGVFAHSKILRHVPPVEL